MKKKRKKKKKRKEKMERKMAKNKNRERSVKENRWLFPMVITKTEDDIRTKMTIAVRIMILLALISRCTFNSEATKSARWSLHGTRKKFESLETCICACMCVHVYTCCVHANCVYTCIVYVFASLLLYGNRYRLLALDNYPAIHWEHKSTDLKKQGEIMSSLRQFQNRQLCLLPTSLLIVLILTASCNVHRPGSFSYIQISLLHMLT